MKGRESVTLPSSSESLSWNVNATAFCVPESCSVHVRVCGATLRTLESETSSLITTGAQPCVTTKSNLSVYERPSCTVYRFGSSSRAETLTVAWTPS